MFEPKYKIKNKTLSLVALVLFTIEKYMRAFVCFSLGSNVYRFVRLFLSCFVTNYFDKASILLPHGHSEVIYRCCNAFVFLLRSSENEEENENIFR